MARRRRKRKSYKKKVSMGTALGLFAGLAKPLEVAMTGNIQEAINIAVANYTGYYPPAGSFNLENAKKGLLPLALGAGLSMAAAKTGVNRRLNLPFIKL